jgi:hypothetical protein
VTFLNPIEEAYLSGMREKMEKRIEKAELNLSIQKGIEVDLKRNKNLRLNGFFMGDRIQNEQQHSGKKPRIATTSILFP